MQDSTTTSWSGWRRQWYMFRANVCLDPAGLGLNPIFLWICTPEERHACSGWNSITIHETAPKLYPSKQQHTNLSQHMQLLSLNPRINSTTNINFTLLFYRPICLRIQFGDNLFTQVCMHFWHEVIAQFLPQNKKKKLNRTQKLQRLLMWY